MWGNTVAIHSVFFFKTTKLNSQPALYLKNKIKKTQKNKKTILEKKIKKMKKQEKTCGEN